MLNTASGFMTYQNVGPLCDALVLPHALNLSLETRATNCLNTNAVMKKLKPKDLISDGHEITAANQQIDGDPLLGEFPAARFL